MPRPFHDLALLVASGFETESEVEEAVSAAFNRLSCELLASPKLDPHGRLELKSRLDDMHVIYDDFIKLFAALPVDKESREIYKFRIARFLDSALIIGSICGNNEADLIKAFIANRTRMQEAEAKNSALRTAIIEEVNAAGLRLRKSEAFARRIEEGVWKRAGVESGTEGFGYASILREIKAILKEKEGQTSA
ncbi:hypothetical protein MPPM_0758 [Methylorubrum populi]|uniref:Uncharacterized protein n=1 Tax=Methylorubrum populi TaxID=223967 RepID=A0A160PBT8_9HYPH|nr:hypothetical protein [Methylorubrum populi]BAU89363.1 hypothetical protein MPPM_0758 [Methylorubrum populi]